MLVAPPPKLNAMLAVTRFYFFFSCKVYAAWQTTSCCGTATIWQGVRCTTRYILSVLLGLLRYWNKKQLTLKWSCKSKHANIKVWILPPLEAEQLSPRLLAHYRPLEPGRHLANQIGQCTKNIGQKNTILRLKFRFKLSTSSSVR